MVGSTQPGLIISALMTESLWKEFEKTGENRIMTGDHSSRVRACRQMCKVTILSYLAPNFAVLRLDTAKGPEATGLCEVESCHTPFCSRLKVLLQRLERMRPPSPDLCDGSTVASLGLHRNQSFLNGAIHKTG